MNWDAIGAVGEVFGAAAVLVTPIYLARQIRQFNEQGHLVNRSLKLRQTAHSHG